MLVKIINFVYINKVHIIIFFYLKALLGTENNILQNMLIFIYTGGNKKLT